MAGDADQWRAWDQRIVEANKEVVAQFRSDAGRVPGYFAGAPMLLLHHLGARTGRARVNPLVYLQDGDEMIIAASKGGSPSHPDWYHNLKAHPRVLVEVGTDAFTVQATEITGVERDELYRRLAHLRPAFAGYETKTNRVIPMFRLTRVTRPADPLDDPARRGSPMSSSPLSTAQTRQFLTDWFERLETSGFDGGVFLGALSDDLIWTATGSSPVSGTFRGKQSYIDNVWRPLDDHLVRWPRANVTRILADGEWAVVEFHGIGGLGRNGTDYTLHYCWVVHAVDDLVRQVVGYYDQVKVNELFEDKP